MNTRKILRNLLSAILTLLMVASIVTCVSAFMIIPLVGPFDDISTFHWAVRDITWLKDNKITTGYPDNTFQPDNSVSRAEMAAFLHREAGALVAAGVHITRTAGDLPVVDRWFNNINDTAPTISGSNGNYTIDFEFDIREKFYVCTVDTSSVATRDAVCSVNSYSRDQILVRFYDISAGSLRPGEFWVLVYGYSIHP